MNWENYDRLVQHLKTMPPAEFDYTRVVVNEPGCLACQCVRLAMSGHRAAEPSDIETFLGVTEDESEYLYTAADDRDLYPGVTLMEKGITNALHRLQAVASRYTRPMKSVDRPETRQVDRERQFLLQCMASASEPVEVE